MERGDLIVRATDSSVLDAVRSAVQSTLCCDVDQRYRVYIKKQNEAGKPLEMRVNASDEGMVMLQAIPGVVLERCL